MEIPPEKRREQREQRAGLVVGCVCTEVCVWGCSTSVGGTARPPRRSQRCLRLRRVFCVAAAVSPTGRSFSTAVYIHISCACTYAMMVAVSPSSVPNGVTSALCFVGGGHFDPRNADFLSSQRNLHVPLFVGVDDAPQPAQRKQSCSSRSSFVDRYTRDDFLPQDRSPRGNGPTPLCL